MPSEPPSYSDDWQQYWSESFDTRRRSRLKTAAENPEQRALLVDVRELNPDCETDAFGIDLEHLREYPDCVLGDAREGFAAFVEDEPIDTARGTNYDVLPIHVAGTSRIQSLRFNTVSFRDLLDAHDKISRVTATVEEVGETESVTTAIGYECPAGHGTRIVQPLYQTRRIDVCGEPSCTNSVFQTSADTTVGEVVRFDVQFDGRELRCVVSGDYTEGRPYENLRDDPGEIQMTGILRNVIPRTGDFTPVYEVLHLDG